MKFYTEEEAQELESKWWGYILPSCQENIDIISTQTKKFEEYEKHLEDIASFKNFNPEFLIPNIASMFNNDEIFARKTLNWANEKIKKESMDYSDNFRIADLVNKEQVRFYNEVKSKGCCGFFDSIEIIEGKKIMIGWNYGH